MRTDSDRFDASNELPYDGSSVFTNPCICGGNYYRYGPGPFVSAGIDNHFHVLLCGDCGLGRTFPSPFDDDRTASIHQELGYEDVLAHRTLWRSFFKPIIAEAKRHEPNGRFLDVGCGVGLSVQIAQEEGYEAWGVEINERSAKFASDTMGWRVLNSDLANAHFPDGHFSVVLLSQVLEHLVKPQPIFAEIRRVLSPNGIVVVEVPNMAGLQVSLLKERWQGWAPNMHVWQFTPRTLRGSLEQMGFRAVSCSARRNMFFGQPHGTLKRLVRNTVLRGVEVAAALLNRADKMICVARPAVAADQ